MNAADRHVILVNYLKSKVEEGDWHGVSDAANDLRVLEAISPDSKFPPSANCPATRFTTDDAPCMLFKGHSGDHQYT